MFIGKSTTPPLLMMEGGETPDFPDFEFETETGAATQQRHEPLWYVILHDDDKHTYQYVIIMLCTLIDGMTPTQAFQHACEVDATGHTIIARLPKQKAADKRDQIMRFGGDPELNSSISMTASIEPCDD
ncbi:ATP-dependent Clp protease adaptor ClpS [Candidatus Sumerlaeota bacterium]|nr:ATP-dependent Clp protease adaptor ClpS [Candidatus Sumerlaeota bacterium]